MKEKLTKLALGEIRTDLETHSRAAMNKGAVAEYCAWMKDGVEFPPITVVYDGTQHILADGFHRIAAMQEAGITETECRVKKGTAHEALLISITSNRKHGLHRTNKDKNNSVVRVLKDPVLSKKFSGRKLAKLCGVSHQTVFNVRDEMNGKVRPKKGRLKKNLPSLEETLETRTNVIEEALSGNNDNLAVTSGQTSQGEVRTSQEDQLESNSDSVQQNQAVAASVESVNIDETEADSALEPTEDVDAEDHDPMEPDQDSQGYDPTQPNSEDSSATTTAPQGDNTSKPSESMQPDEDDDATISLKTYRGRIEIDLPEVEATSEAEARKMMTKAFTEDLLENWETTDMVKVFLKSDVQALTDGIGEAALRGEKPLRQAINSSLLAAHVFEESHVH